MIRKSVRQPLTVCFVALGLLGSYVLLRGAGKTSSAATKTEIKTASASVSVAGGMSQSPAPDGTVSELPAANSIARKRAPISGKSAAKRSPASVSSAIARAAGSTANPKPINIGLKNVSLTSEPADPISLAKPLAAKMPAPAPVPQGGSGSPPNAPTVSSPADGGTGVSTSPTLKVNVSDPNSNNVTVNFYGKVVPSVAPGPAFQIIELPDTQYYSAGLENGTIAIFKSQTQWIVNNRVANNIVFVTGLGDVVQDGNNNGDYSEWVNADSAVSLMDDPVATGLPHGIPYSFGVGNHDQGPSGDGSPDDTAGFNQYFGAARYANKPEYAGHYGSDNDNHYELFSASGMDFILINIAYMDPQYDGAELNSVLAWANGLLQTYSTRRGIVVSHYILNNGFNASWSGQGQVMYNALSGNPNLFLMLAGHLTPPEGQRTDVSNGNRVFSFLSDYQESGFGGDGWLRILNFLPATNQIQVQTYSPYINQYESTSSGNFTVSYDMKGSGNGFTLLASKAGVLSGTSTSYTWPSLAPGSSYEWYVTVSNSTGTAVGPLWSFTTTGNAPVTFSPPSLTFPSQNVNTTSASQAVTLSNTGSAALSISSIASSAQYAQTNNCPISPSTLAVNSVCTINVTFTPTAGGTQSGSISVTDSAVGSPQVISLTGTGTTVLAPAVSISPGSLALGTPTVAVVQDTATTGSGSTTLAMNFPSNVTKNNLIVVGVSSFAGNAFASPAITDTLGSTWSLAVANNPGTTGTPALASLYYAVAPSTGADTVTVHMTGTNNLHLHIYEISGLVTSSVLDQIGSNFQSGTAATVSTAASTAAANEFVLAYFGRDNGSGTWTAGTGYGNTLASPNSGAGTDAFSEAKIVSSTAKQTATVTSSASDSLTSVIATFVAAGGGTAVGTTSAAQALTLNNTGSASLSISSIVATGDFNQTNNCGSMVAVGGSCTISVTFTPTATGTRNGAITVTDNAGNSPQSVSLTGIGTPASGPAVNLSPTGLAFGNQTVNTASATQAVTLNNVGSASLTITSIVPSAQYSQTNTCGAAVAAGGNCVITVTFTPTATGSQPGTITVTDNAPGSPHVVNLTGTGIVNGISISPPSLTFGNQPLNTPSAAQSITLTNSSGAALTISSIAPSAQYSQTNNCPISPSTLAVNGVCTINITFTPTATGAQSGSVTFTDSAAGSPQIVGLTGTGTSALAPAVSISPASLSMGSPSIALVQDTGTTGSGSTTLAMKFPSNVTKNNLIVVGVSSASGNAFASPAITDTLGSTFSLAVADNPGTAGTPSLASLYYAVAPATGADTVTVHMTGTNNLHLHIYEVSGLLTSSVLDQIGSNFQSGTTAATVSTAASTTTANEFVFAYFGRDNGVGTWTAGNGYANGLASPNSGSSTDAFSEDNIISAIGIQTATATASASDGLTSVIATFAAAGGGTQVGTTSAAQTLTLNNTGSASLSISSIVASGDFQQTNTCGTLVAVASSCTISVTFTPTATGTRTGAITLSDNAGNSPQSVTLTGVGTPASGPVANLSGTSLAFGNQTVNTPSTTQAVTLNNIGSTTLSITSIVPSAQYSETDTCNGSVTAGGNCVITVTFTPTATGAQNGTMTITDNAPGSPHVVNLTGTGIPPTAPAVGLSPNSLTFSSQTVGTSSASQAVTLTNSGNAALGITSIAPSAQYSQTNTCGASVAIGGQCTISVTFTPTATGTQTGTITITDNATGSPHTVNLTGTGAAAVPAVTLSTTSLSFGSQTVNTTSAAQTVTLTNSGTGALGITSIAASAEYSQTNTCGSSVAVGAKCTISVSFTPTATGVQTGTITITDTAAGSPHIVNLTGTGAATAPAVSLSPTTLTFASQTLNTTSAAQTITLNNTGNGALGITSIAASAQYAQTNTCGSTVTAGGTCTISVTFTPTASGTQAGAITITDNAGGSPHVVSLTGTGTTAGNTTVSLSVSSLTFTSQQINTTSSAKTVTLTNKGTTTLAITSIVASGDFTQTNNCGTSLNGSALCTITVKFVPTAAGTRTGAITLTDSATGSPQTVALTGTAADITLSPTTLSFGTQALNTASAAQTITLTNAGTVTLTITKVTVTKLYTQTNTCGTSVAGGASCTFSVTFTPTTVGTHNGTLTITDNATGSPKTVTLTGSGL
jgi:hypothetical protein